MRGKTPRAALSIGPPALLALFCLGGCNQGPPTSSEMQSAYTSFWNKEVGPADAFPGADGDEATYLSVASVKPDATPTTSKTAGGDEIYRVGLAFTFSAKRDLSYACNAWMAKEATAEVMYSLGSYFPTQTSPGLANQLRSGGSFSCSHTLSFQKVAKGWLMLKADGTGYLIPR
jgi:hypothetical protein